MWTNTNSNFEIFVNQLTVQKNDLYVNHLINLTFKLM